MKVLVACEFSQVVTKAFRARGHEAFSCDILPTDGNPDWHYEEPVEFVLRDNPNQGLMIAHPPCTYTCNSGVSWLIRKGVVNEARWFEMEHARDFFLELLNKYPGVKRICIENPIPHKYAMLPKYTQIVQPWMFGEDASKATCLWLKNLPKLIPTNIIKKKRYANQTPSGQNNLGPSENRWKLRSITYQGLANAMAEQWGTL